MRNRWCTGPGRTPHTRPSARSAPRGAGGSLAVEYAIVLPALLMFLLGLIDTGRLLWTYTTLSRAVAAGSRCASVDTIDCPTASAVKSYAAGQAWGLGLASSAFTVTTPACGTQVQGTMTFQFFI